MINRAYSIFICGLAVGSNNQKPIQIPKIAVIGTVPQGSF